MDPFIVNANLQFIKRDDVLPNEICAEEKIDDNICEADCGDRNIKKRLPLK